MKVRILLSTALAVIGFGVMAQLKIGYTNVEYVLSLMPEAKQIESELGGYEKQLAEEMFSSFSGGWTRCFKQIGDVLNNA